MKGSSSRKESKSAKIQAETTTVPMFQPMDSVESFEIV
jgi:hypothetical protein